MATSAASAAGSESNRAAYARNLDPNIDSNRLRVDEATLSAFDLLLDLPIFENQIPQTQSASEIDSVAKRESDDDSYSDEREAGSTENGPSPSLLPIPIVPRIEESLKQNPHRSENDTPKIDIERVRAVDSQPNQDSQTRTTLGTDAETEAVQPIDAVNSESDEPLPAQRHEVVANQSYQSTLEHAPIAATVVKREPLKPDQQNDQDSFEIDPLPHDRHKKTSKAAFNEVSSSQTQNKSSLSQAGADSKQPKKVHKREGEFEAPKPSTVATPAQNRRADRLAESKRGETRNHDREDGEHDSSESTSSNGNIAIPNELTLESEQNESVPSLDAIHALANSEIANPDATLSETVSSQQTVRSPIISSSIVANSPSTTSVTGLEGGKDSVVHGVGAPQGSSSIAERSASRATTSFGGRASTLSPYQEHRVLQRVLKGLEQLDNGGGSVRLRLHPPELGSLQITLRVEAQQVSALIEVEHSAARDVLLSNLPQLQTRLSEQGLNVSQFDVQVVDPNQWSHENGSGWEMGNGQSANQNDSESKRSSRYMERMRNQIDRVPSSEGSPTPQSLWTRKNGQLDVRV